MIPSTMSGTIYHAPTELTLFSEPINIPPDLKELVILLQQLEHCAVSGFGVDKRHFPMHPLPRRLVD